jgi:hypothetical protein
MQELGIGVNMTLIKQNAFQLLEVTSTNSLIKGGKARKVSSFIQYMICHQAQLYPQLQDSTFQHQSSLQTGYFTTSSNSTTVESDSVLSLAKYSDLKCDNRRRTSNPYANILTPLSEPKLLGRPNTSYCLSTHRPN